MTSQSGIHIYMEKHRIRALFEELMNKVLRDMPEEPLVYLLRSVYKKAGMEIPQTLRYGGLRKSTSDLQKTISPERRSRSAAVSMSADMAALRLRSTSPTRATKFKDGAKSTKQKPEWNSDNKTKSSFDELWDETAAAKKEKILSKSSVLRRSNMKQGSTLASAWASLGLGEEVEGYTSPAYQGQRQNQGPDKISDTELLAMENVKRSSRSQTNLTPPPTPVISSGHYINSRKMESIKHKQELGQLLGSTDHKLTDSGIGLDLLKDDNDDDAIELLENGEDLKLEGVKNIPKTGFKLSKNVRHRENEPCMKLSINAYVYSSENADKFVTSETEGYTSDADEDEEFESVSQVSGPRQPVWNVPGSQILAGDAIPLQPSYSTSVAQDLHPQRRTYIERALLASAPAHLLQQPADNTGNLVAATKQWSTGAKNVSLDIVPQTSRSVHSTSSASAWRLPDDTDADSEYDWNQRVNTKPARDPRAY